MTTSRLPSARQKWWRIEHQRRGVVVDDGRGFGAAQNREAVFEIRRAAATCAAGQTVFEVAVVGADLATAHECVGAERGAAEIGVDQDAGRR